MNVKISQTIIYALSNLKCKVTIAEPFVFVNTWLHMQKNPVCSCDTR